MPDSRGLPPGTVPADAASRHDRLSLLAFIADAAGEAALRDGLAEFAGTELEVRRGNVAAATAAMRKQSTPRVLVVDIAGQDQPLSALRALAQVVEPDVCVLVIGEVDSAEFYREVTRGLGAADYLPRPLTREKVARQFGPLVLGQAPSSRALGGRSVAITGARGGVGATTLAVNLAWRFGVIMRRHTVLLDPDLHRGMAAFLLNVRPGGGLRQALEAPERIDVLLAERAAQPAADRLHVLSDETDLATRPDYAPGAAAVLMDALRRRYNFIVADVPFAAQPLHRDLLGLVHQRVFVLEPTLASVRETLRLLALPGGAEQRHRPILVLNRLGRPGGLGRRHIEDALKTRVDLTVPDLPRLMGTAATLGEPAAAARGAFRAALDELVRQVGSTGLLDAAAGPAEAVTLPPRRRWRLFRRDP
jgi:pilus assembly protein CpaE